VLSSRPAALVLAAALSLGIAACGDDGDGEARDPLERATTTAGGGDDEETTTTAGDDTTTTTASLDDEGIGALEAVLSDLLVTAEELGDPSFVDVGYSPEDGDGENVCGVDVDADVPPATVVGRQLESESLQLAFQQELRGYDSIDGAAEAYAAGLEGTSCGTSPDGTITLTAPQDVTAQVGGDEAFAVGVTGEGIEGVLVAVRVTDVIATFQFAGATGAAEAAGAPDPIDVAAFGVGKLLAFLEG
jgi:hypothetical protein